ncbi:MAG: hypothetical protein MUE56_02510 [Ignavibacteria bacterium]|jgi:hypothetical protein|nr:hypothetical protein [Ignavibacteria bacterium]
MRKIILIYLFFFFSVPAFVNAQSYIDLLDILLRIKSGTPEREVKFGKETPKYRPEKINYDDYDDDFGAYDLAKLEPNFILGFLTTTTKYPDRFGLEQNPLQSGFLFGTKYKMHTLEEISTAGVGKFSINLMGNFRLGFAGNSEKMSYVDNYTKYQYDVKHYTAVGDLFSMGVNAEYKTGILAGRGMVFGISATFFNIGGTVTYMSGGRFDDEIVGIVNFLPLYIEPYAKIKFSGGTIGLGLLLNPYSFVEYRFGPAGFYDANEEGIQVNSTKISKYAVELHLLF